MSMAAGSRRSSVSDARQPLSLTRVSVSVQLAVPPQNLIRHCHATMVPSMKRPKRGGAHGLAMPPGDEPEPTPPPANDDAPAAPAPPAAKSAVVSTTSRKRAKLLRAELPDDPKAFLKRMVRPPGRGSG
jgi:hypothetical protein